MRYFLLISLCIVQFSTNGQTMHVGTPTDQSDRAYRFEQVVVNAACGESRKLVKREWQHTKGLKFAEDYQYGDEYPVDDDRYDSTYCISSYFTYKGDFGETFSEYYYCWLKLMSLKPERWQQIVMRFSPLPFN